MAEEQDVTQHEEPIVEGPGLRLRRAREGLGLDRKAIAATTKIPERLIQAMEEDNFAALPARAYAIGFSRSYARAVGLDPVEIVHDVGEGLDRTAAEREPRRAPTLEPGDPARVPSLRIAWLAAAAALAAIVAGLFFLGSPGTELEFAL